MSSINSGRLSIVGGGNMGSAMARGLLAGGLLPSNLVIVESDSSKHAELKTVFADSEVSEKLSSCESVVVAVKPAQVLEVCRSASQAGAKRILSVAAGVKIAAIESATDGSVAVIRAMPNTPALIGQGASAMAVNSKCSDDDARWAREVLLSVGTVVDVKEDLLDAVTGLSGSGPAYIFLLAEALIKAGIDQGLSAEVANELTRQLLVGSALLLAESPESPAQLREKVTSPNGTTAAGIAELVGKQFAQIIGSAVDAATKRSRELGK